MESVDARYRGLVLVALVPLFFSTNVVIGRAVAGDIGPWTLAFLRWTGAFLILLPFAAPGLVAHRRALAGQGALIAALGSTTATNATLIYTSANVMILILEWLFRGRPIGPRELIGTILALAGVALVTLKAEGAAGFRLNAGDLFIAFAAFSWAVYSVLLKRPGLAALPGVPLFASIMLTGSVMLLPMMLWETTAGQALPENAGAWLAVLGVALLPSVGAFSGYQYGIRRFGPGTMAMLSYLTTPYGVLLAILFLGEELRSYHLLGLALIVPGVILATAKRLPWRFGGRP